MHHSFAPDAEVVNAAVRQFGYTGVAIFGGATFGQPAFMYTIGLTEMGHPELIVYDVAVPMLGMTWEVLDKLIRHVLRDGDLRPDASYPVGTFAATVQNAIIDPNRPPALAQGRYGGRVRLLEVLVPFGRQR